MLRTGDIKSITASLVLATGSRAGMEAPLHYGYYLIGRHGTCQIRPKSRSVSRHHCVIHLKPNSLRVFDLKSTSGTRVNDNRIEPRTWTHLSDGDTLRCGKICFTVSICEHAGSAHDPTADFPTSVSMVAGDAWQEIDLSEYLDPEPSGEYGGLDESIEDTLFSDPDEDGAQVDIFEDARESPSNRAASAPVSEPQQDSLSKPDDASNPSDDAPAEQVGDEQAGKPESKKSTRRSPKPIRIPKAKSSRRRLPSLSAPSLTGLFSDGERLKLLGLALVSVLMIGAASYSAYRFFAGPSVNVVKGID